MLRVASTDLLCAMKPDDHHMNTLLPDDWILPKHRYSLPPVCFGRPFLHRYEPPIGLVRGEKRLVFVRHFLIQFRCAIAGRFGQEISTCAGAFFIFWCPPALSAAAV